MKGSLTEERKESKCSAELIAPWPTQRGALEQVLPFTVALGWVEMARPFYPSPLTHSAQPPDDGSTSCPSALCSPDLERGSSVRPRQTLRELAAGGWM